METHVNASLINGEICFFDMKLKIADRKAARIDGAGKHSLTEAVWRLKGICVVFVN
jgi:hypothetical protein